MPKSLEDFEVKVNLKGWHIRGFTTFNEGQVLTGKSIHPRVLAALKAKETFGKAKTPVCELVKGDLADLEAAMSAAGAEAGSVKPAIRHEPKLNEGDTPGPQLPKNTTTVIEPKTVEKKVEEPKAEEPKVEEPKAEPEAKPVVKKTAVKKTSK